MTRCHRQNEFVRPLDKSVLDEQVQCIECGKDGGAFVLMVCEHDGGFLVHAKRRCLRRIPKSAKVHSLDAWDMRAWVKQGAAGRYGTPGIGCDECRMIPSLGIEDKKADVSTTSEYKMNETTKHSGFMAMVAEKIKAEGGQAGLRIGAQQFSKTARAPILGILKQKRVNITELQKMLDTPIGEGVFNLFLGYAVPYLPRLGPTTVTTRLGEELRVQGWTLIGGELADVLLDPLREALVNAFADAEEQKR